MFRFTLVSCLLIVAAQAHYDKPKDETRAEAAKHINEYLDKSVSPCDNFFKFACGNWKNFNTLPEGKLDATGFSKLNENIQKEIKLMLEQSDVIYNPEVELKVKEFYKSCLNTEKIIQRGFEPIHKFIKNNLGDFPIFNKEWDESKFECVEYEQKLKQYGLDGLVGIKVLNNKDKLYVGEVALSNRKEDYANPQIMDAYTERITGFFGKTLGFGDVAKDVAKEVVDFEKELSKFVADDATKADESKYFVHTTVEELNKKYPKVQWEKFLTQSVGTAVELSRPVVEFNPDYLPNLLKLVDKTPKKIVANYMLWHGMGEFIPAISPPTAATNKEDVWKFCIAQTKEYYPKEIAVMYSRKYYENEVQSDLEEMFKDIKKTVHKKFESIDWIDDVTRKLAFERLDGAKIEIIGYPKGIEVPVASDFNTIVSNPDEYYENVFNKLKYNIYKYRSSIVSGKSIDDYVKDPASLLARYNVEDNVLKISLGFLNPPFYIKTLPRNMKFAQLGAIIVHELLHGFDGLGQTVPVNNVPAPWWSESSANVFNQKLQCFEKQYSKHGGTTSVNDNAADNGGIKYAFETYKDWLESIKETKKDVYDEEVFTGVEYTNTQLFFLTHAQTWCHYSKPNPTATEFTYPSEYRINLPMTNYEGFSKEFQCAEGTPMNPKDKCVLW